MPTRSPLPVLGRNTSPLPKLVDPVSPKYPSEIPPDGAPVSINPISAAIALGPPNGVLALVSPIKFTAPLPFATTLCSDHIASSIINADHGII
jgi:hypothetical protein